MGGRREWGNFRESGPLQEVTSELKFERLSINPRSGGRAFQKLCWYVDFSVGVMGSYF